MIMTECPNCCAHIEVKVVPVIGLPVECYYCDVQLEITWLYPITLDFPEKQLSHQQEVEINSDRKN